MVVVAVGNGWMVVTAVSGGHWAVQYVPVNVSPMSQRQAGDIRIAKPYSPSNSETGSKDQQEKEARGNVVQSLWDLGCSGLYCGSGMGERGST